MNILDAMDAHMYGREAVLQFMAEFQAEWNEPMFALAAEILNRQSPLIRQMAMSALPPDLAQVMEVYHAHNIQQPNAGPTLELDQTNQSEPRSDII